MWTYFYAVPAEYTTIQGESVPFQCALSHHQRSCGANLHTGATRHAVCIVQADIERCRDNRIKTLTKHTVAIWTDYVMTNTHALSAIYALIGIAQNEAM